MASRRGGGRGVLTLLDYFSQASKSDRFRDKSDSFNYYAFGLFGEVGGLLAAFKKHERDELEEPQRVFASEEVGDSLWYLMHAADRVGVRPDDLGRAALQWLANHHHVAVKKQSTSISFSDLDNLAASARTKTTKAGQSFLRRMARRCGILVGHNHRARAPSEALIEQFGALLAMLAMLTCRWNLTMEAIARDNLGKIKDRWPGSSPQYRELYDDKYEPHEQLPRRFSVNFTERNRSGSNYVTQSIKGIAIGDPLTDNNDRDDGYRFHDVFHFAYVVHLGWSPVIRALLKVKRKSDPKVDTNQDGARAIIIEEGIATWIFNYADYNTFSSIREGDLDFSLLKQVRKLVRSYEVEDCPLWQWERAILNGMRVFKQLYDNHGGVVTIDILKRKLTYAPPRTAEKRRRSNSAPSTRLKTVAPSS